MAHFSGDMFSWQCFLTAAHFGSIRQAAKELRMEPSSVSRRIANLERELGVEFFEKNGAALKLSPDGVIAQKNFAPLVRAQAVAVRNISRKIAPVRSSMHVIAPIGYSLVIVRRAIANMDAPAGSVRFWLESGQYGEERFESLGHGIDVIVSTIERDNPKFVKELISNHKNYCFASPLFSRKHPLNEPKDLLDLPLGGNTQFITNTVFVHKKTHEKQSFALDFSLLSDNTALLMDWAANGHGVLVKSPFTAAAELIKNGNLVRMLKDWELPNNHVWAYAARKDFTSPGSLIPSFFKTLKATSDLVAEVSEKIYEYEGAESRQNEPLMP